MIAVIEGWNHGINLFVLKVIDKEKFLKTKSFALVLSITLIVTKCIFIVCGNTWILMELYKNGECFFQTP